MENQSLMEADPLSLHQTRKAKLKWIIRTSSKWIKANPLNFVFCILFVFIILELWTIHNDLSSLESDNYALEDKVRDLDGRVADLESKICDLEDRVER